LAQRVYVHVGTPKSGTTFLQAGLWHHREQLREHGLLYPGRRPHDHNRASIAVRNGAHVGGSPKAARVWSRFLREAADFDGTVVLSNEWYLAAGQEQARAAVEQLGGDRVHVVVTTRSFVRVVPAAWQESLKVGRGHSLTDFASGLATNTSKWSWSSLDPALVARRWAELVGTDQVHVVTMPEVPAHPGQLWERFLTTVGLSPDSVELPAREANESLSVQAARLLQDFGPVLRAEVDRFDKSWRGHSRWLRRAVVREALVGVPGDPIGVGADLRDTLVERAEQSVADLRDLGCPVTGDLDDLLGGSDRDGARHPDTVTEAELLDVARHLTSRLLVAQIEQAGGSGPDGADRDPDDADDLDGMDDTDDTDDADDDDNDEEEVAAVAAPDEPVGPQAGATDQAAHPAATEAPNRSSDGGDRTRRWTFMVPSAYAAGGIARTVFTTANVLAARGHQVTILTLSRSSAEPKFHLDPRVELIPLQDRYDPENPSRPRRSARHDPRADPVARELDAQPSRLAAGARKTFSAYVDSLLEQRLSAQPPGVVVSTRPEFAVAASRWSHPRSILLHQEHLSFLPRPEPLRAALRDLAVGRGGDRRIDALLTLTEADHERWRAYVDDPSVRTGVIPNPTPFEVGEPAPLTNKVVIAAGRLTSQKGFERLVEAWVPLATSHPDWQLRIYGDGQQWDALNEQVARSGVSDRILMGGVTDQLEAELAASSVYAMSSRYEGLPMVLLEALSKGVPPVSFDCPEGPRQLIDNGVNGLLVPEGDVPALTKGLQTLMDDEDLRRRLGARALETARDYQADAVTERWLELVAEIDAARGD
jgi:glycosyltransferase involved in cell wall biosynthesis